MIIKQASTQYEYFSLMQIRCKVFMSEQNVDPLIEMDEEDKTCMHYILEDHQTIIATCRVLTTNNVWHLGRIAVLKEYRNQQYGSKLIQHMINLAIKNNIKKIELGAQVQAIPFYESLGFKTYGKVYLDANIEHKDMEMIL
ncbi:MAG: GNAT family N-acetyltransferase [Bacilli bacterium]|nr:GNAT family N-acetyltransferase [Bacilli bacterium]